MKRPANDSRIFVTSGDPDGIGSEVCAKALRKLGPQRGIQFILWRSPECPKTHLRMIDARFRRKTVSTLEEGLRADLKSSVLIDICSDRTPGAWVEASAKACRDGRAEGLVTAPLSKTGLKKAGFKDLGHTEIFKRVCRTQNLHMAFLGSKFNVVLASDHIPLKDVPTQIVPRKLAAVIDQALALRRQIADQRPVAILGLNPHAGESGLLGQEDGRIRRLIERDYRGKVFGPLVPDAAFLPSNLRKYSIFVCLYHDQGLIPFKMAHGFDEGVHLTLGLPFVRTSVDHGTAKELFGLNRAKAGSMISALDAAVQLIRKGRSIK